MTMPAKKIVCAYCERSIRVNRDGRVRKHGACRGSGRHESGFQHAPPEVEPRPMTDEDRP